jgi:hypothetical protein
MSGESNQYRPSQKARNGTAGIMGWQVGTVGFRWPSVESQRARRVSEHAGPAPTSRHGGSAAPIRRRRQRDRNRFPVCVSASTARLQHQSGVWVVDDRASPWSSPWSLSERISGDFRTPQSRSHASRHPTAPPRPSFEPSIAHDSCPRAARRVATCVSGGDLSRGPMSLTSSVGASNWPLPRPRGVAVLPSSGSFAGADLAGSR